ncbi:MAG: hypothetical protein ABW051_06510 [Burkholderiaceae bacterium]
MNIHQLSVNYINEQDRILVRINTTAGEELRLWLTRRLTLGLVPVLGRVVAEQAVTQETAKTPGIAPAVADPETKKMLAEFKKEETLQKADFKTPYRDQAAALPLGAEPLLVTEVNVTPTPTGQLQLSFQEKLPGAPQPRGFQMALESQLTHGLLHLVEKALVVSEWRGPAPAGAVPPAAAPEEPPTGGKPRYLN